MSETRTAINWYPGHMAKARREMSEQVRLVDMVIELRDGRIPFSSVNPVLAEIIGTKPRLIILAKKDKADDKKTAAWLQYYRNQGIKAVAMDLLHENLSARISALCTEIMQEKIQKQKARGLKHVEIKAMVVGIPNVGKSTLINNVSRRKAAKTADKPGVTRSLQWIRVSSDVALLDTPGVLWPKFENDEIGYRLALCGSINGTILPVHELAVYALNYLVKEYPHLLAERYGIEPVNDIPQLIEEIGQARKLFTVEGKVDVNRTELLILQEIKDGAIGAVTWESPDENQE